MKIANFILKNAIFIYRKDLVCLQAKFLNNYMAKIKVQDTEITIITNENQDFISQPIWQEQKAMNLVQLT